MDTTETIPDGHLTFAKWCEAKDVKPNNVIAYVNGRPHSVTDWFKPEKHPLYITAEPIHDADGQTIYGVLSPDGNTERCVLIVDDAGSHIDCDFDGDEQNHKGVANYLFADRV